MGGTTTDVGILRNGTPRLEKEGAVIGGRRTRVLAAEIATSGIGGDSRILVNGGQLSLASLRVVPLCIAASKYPCLLEKLKKVANMPARFTPGCLDEKKVMQEIEYFIKLKDIEGIYLTEDDNRFLAAIEKEPKSLTEAGDELGIHPYSININKMEEVGMIQRIGLTPTDILHGEGNYVEFNREASLYGIRHQAGKMKLSDEEFIKLAKQAVIDKIAKELLKKLMFEETGQMYTDKIGNDLMDKAITGKMGLDFGCRIKLNKPIIGIGAPVSAYFPQVAEKFDTKLLLSEYSHVGNAVGAITGNIVESIDIVIKPKKGEGGSDDPRCTIFASFGTFEYDSYKAALAFAEEKARDIMSEAAVKAGADKIEIKTDLQEKKFGFDETYGGSVLIEAKLTVTAVGKPKEFSRMEESSYYSDLDKKWDV
ncbi:MAG: hydantoinase/oxoprolinase family protein, partial [Candidatus Methanomethylophilaceae archaeon]|nr:hydantoinase/oxoprolinase family protein [Candidatus Methanomethylophilaceae archaeon]